MRLDTGGLVGATVYLDTALGSRIPHRQAVVEGRQGGRIPPPHLSICQSLGNLSPCLCVPQPLPGSSTKFMSMHRLLLIKHTSGEEIGAEGILQS
jgi:hypothetical protein